MENELKRNGAIELMRFVFCICIIIYHINNRIELPKSDYFSFCQNGNIGVEFFFLVSGWLMMNSVIRHGNEEAGIRKPTLHFMKKKLRKVLPHHILVFGTVFLLYFWLGPIKGIENNFKKMADCIPAFFLIQKSGVDSFELLRYEWYIGAMLVGMAVLYPLLVKYRKAFSAYICPLLSVLLIGYMAHNSHRISGIDRFIFADGIISKTYVRAVAIMALGMFCYEISAFLSRRNFSRIIISVMTTAEVICYALTLLFAFSCWESKYEATVCYLMAIAVSLTFSGKTLSAKLSGNKVLCYLGKLSFPLYMMQGISLTFIRYVIPDTTPAVKVFTVFAMTLCIALITQPISKSMLKFWDKNIKER